jgi:hypothetical protein
MKVWKMIFRKPLSMKQGLNELWRESQHLIGLSTKCMELIEEIGDLLKTTEFTLGVKKC